MQNKIGGIEAHISIIKTNWNKTDAKLTQLTATSGFVDCVNLAPVLLKGEGNGKNDMCGTG